MLLLGVPRFSDYAGPTSHSRLPRPIVLPSPSGDWVGALKEIFEAQSPRPPMPLSTLQASPHDDTCKTQGQDGVAYSFPAGLLHPLQHAGLSRRTLSPKLPHLTVGSRGPTDKDQEGRPEIHYTRIYSAFREWQADGCFDDIFAGSPR